MYMEVIWERGERVMSDIYAWRRIRNKLTFYVDKSRSWGYTNVAQNRFVNDHFFRLGGKFQCVILSVLLCPINTSALICLSTIEDAETEVAIPCLRWTRTHSISNPFRPRPGTLNPFERCAAGFEGRKEG